MNLLNKKIDHTLLKPDASQTQILKLCREANDYNFASVCVNGYYTSFAAKILSGSDVKVATVTGFPLGAATSKIKYEETKEALNNGSSEIDTVINIAALKDGKFQYIQDELSLLSKLCHEHDAILKVIFETCLLTKDEIKNACILSKKSNVDFIKTSTGFNNGGAKIEDVKLMKSIVGDCLKIKASGGIRTLAFAKKLLDAGADRLGCSASIEIVKENEK